MANADMYDDGRHDAAGDAAGDRSMWMDESK